MRISLQEGKSAAEISLRDWSVVLHGECVDDRGKAAISELGKNCKSAFKVIYDPDSLEVEFDGEKLDVDTLTERLESLKHENFVFETSTMGFVEILLCCRALYSLGVANFDLVYVEPKNYRIPPGEHLIHRRDFELSNEVHGYRAIPGYGILLDRRPKKGVFLLGFEDARLRRAFEDLQAITASEANVVFGVPAFKPGWEMDSIANNISVIREQNIRSIHFCGAENPASLVELLSEIYRGLEDEERLFLAPIGTKPHGIGTALFAATHKGIGVIYDHPQRKPGRSSNMGRWHLFSVTEFGS